jgi:NAD(P)-dependent dehydrogenase (short-subunit alcohol dehydrogenase family)
MTAVGPCALQSRSLAPSYQIEALFDELSDIHFKGAFFTGQRALPHLRQGGSIILISSSPAQSRGAPMTSIYNAAKAAVRSLGRSLASELLPRSIRVNTIGPRRRA